MKSLEGKNIQLNDISLDTTIQTLIIEAAKALNIPPASTNLLFCGQTLDPQQRLSHYKVEADSTLHVIDTRKPSPAEARRENNRKVLIEAFQTKKWQKILRALKDDPDDQNILPALYDPTEELREGIMEAYKANQFEILARVFAGRPRLILVSLGLHDEDEPFPMHDSEKKYNQETKAGFPPQYLYYALAKEGKINVDRMVEVALSHIKNQTYGKPHCKQQTLRLIARLKCVTDKVGLTYYYFQNLGLEESKRQEKYLDTYLRMRSSSEEEYKLFASRITLLTGNFHTDKSHVDEAIWGIRSVTVANKHAVNAQRHYRVKKRIERMETYGHQFNKMLKEKEALRIAETKFAEEMARISSEKEEAHNELLKLTEVNNTKRARNHEFSVRRIQKAWKNHKSRRKKSRKHLLNLKKKDLN